MARTDRNRVFNQLVSSLTREAVLSVEGASSVPKKGIVLSKDKRSQQLIVDVFLNVRRGCKIPEAAWKIQDSVKKRLEAEADASVYKVNIHIQGVDRRTENKDA